MIKKAVNPMNWNLGKLPFVGSYLSKPTNGAGIPDMLPFTFTLNVNTGTVTQAYNKEIARSLKKVYEKGSQISGNMNEQDMGSNYTQDFIKFICKSFSRRSFNKIKVLEIGCGTGYLLYRLKQMGACVLGVEPGHHEKGKTKNYRVPIIRDFFPSKKINGKFDMVIISSVLEHINNPVEFLTAIKKYMKIKGKLIISVPDGRPFFKNGDMSLPFHEHWNYFTKDSLFNTLTMAGFDRVHIQKGNFGSVLHGCSMVNKNSARQKMKPVNMLARAFKGYKKNADMHSTLVSRYIDKAFKDGKTVGVYVPGRILNILAYKKTIASHLRFFEDDSLAHGKYFPGFAIPIESQDDLIKNPTDIVLIMSLAFGDRIKVRLKRILPDNCRIKICREFFSQIKH